MSIELLKDLLVLAPAIGVVYAPFHYLDKFASSKARARAKAAIKERLSPRGLGPLVSLLDRFFGKEHFTARCFMLSSAMSIIFTFLLLGITNQYIYPIEPYLSDYSARREAAEKKLHEAFTILIEVQEFLLSKIESSDNEELKRQAATVRVQKTELERLVKEAPVVGAPLLLWMLLSVALSANVLADFIALWKTRWILRRIAAQNRVSAVLAYLALDMLLASGIWIVAAVVFLLVNGNVSISWAHETPPLVFGVAVVSLLTTIATSIWIYTYLLGILLSRTVLKGVTELVDPEEHTFKVIGILGTSSIVLVAGIFIALIKYAL